MHALQRCGHQDIGFAEAAVSMREEYRLNGRALPRRAVGSTLLLKGLEADVAVILQADELDARNFYVAMTTVSRPLVICSCFPQDRLTNLACLNALFYVRSDTSELGRCRFPERRTWASSTPNCRG